MALNCAMLDGDRNPIPLPNEVTVMTIDSGVDLVLTIPDMSGDGPKLRTLKASGRAWITDQRVRFFRTVGVPTLTMITPVPLHLWPQLGIRLSIYPPPRNPIYKVRTANVQRQLPLARDPPLQRRRPDERHSARSPCQEPGHVPICGFAGEDEGASDLHET